MKFDDEFAIAKIEGKVLFMAIVPVIGEMCLELCIGTHFFYVPIDENKMWFESCTSNKRYDTWKEFIKGEHLENAWNGFVWNN